MRKPKTKVRSDAKDNYCNYNLRGARIRAGYTGTELAELIGVSPGAYHNYERLRAIPDELTAKRIAIVLNERLRTSDSIDNYVQELFPEKLRGYVQEIQEERKTYDSSEDILGQAIPIHRIPEKRIPESEFNTLQSASESELRGRINKVLKTLSYREREILKLKYGLNDGYSYNFEEIGHIFKVTRERIRQIEAQARRQLQQPERSERLVGFLD